jgi:hypothetical protein
VAGLSTSQSGVLAIEQISRQNPTPVLRLKEEQSVLWLKTEL